MSASLRSRRVGSLVAPTCASVTMTRTGPSSQTISPSRISYSTRPRRGCRARRGGCPAPAPRSSRPRRSGCSSSRPSRGSRCRPPCGPGCVRRRSRRGTAPAATRRRTARRRRRRRPARSPVTSRPRWIGTPQLVDPAGEDALDVVLPQPEPVRVAGREVADVQADAGEARDLRRLALREEPIGDAALVEHLDRARVQAAGARAGEVLVWRAARRSRRRRPPAPARRPASARSDRRRRSPPHARTHPCLTAPVPSIHLLGGRLWGTTGGLPQAPRRV